MTTSYPLSIRLKELGVPQEGGEYYWVQYPDWTFMDEECQDYIATELVHKNDIGHDRFYALDEVQCRALTLGELARELPDGFSIFKQGGFHAEAHIEKKSDLMEYDFDEYLIEDKINPEEAAGELLAELKQKEVSNG